MSAPGPQAQPTISTISRPAHQEKSVLCKQKAGWEESVPSMIAGARHLGHLGQCDSLSGVVLVHLVKSQEVMAETSSHIPPTLLGQSSFVRQTQ